MKVAVIDYNAGNTRSVYFAMQRLGVDAVFSHQPEEIQSADKVLFPGVGEANTTMQFLKAKKLDQVIQGLKQPVLGICLGMQLMCRWSEENDTICLGIFENNVLKFQPNDLEKVPHMGWNQIKNLSSDMFPLSIEGAYVYFVHSYYVEISPGTTASCKYIHPFSAAIRKDNFYATQFHPEKSGPVGEKFLKYFLQL